TRYRTSGIVKADLALEQGGIAKLVYVDKKKVSDLWLFGPLVLDGTAYGSLMVELGGFEDPQGGDKFTKGGDKKTGKELPASDPKSQRFLVKFPRTYGRFMPCKLWGSTYSDGLRPANHSADHIIHDGGSTVHWEDGYGPGEEHWVEPGPAPKFEDAI